MNRYEFSDGTSNKFWEIEQADCQLNLRWGKINTQGQSQTKDFDSAALAKAAMDKLIKEKTKKGYIASEYIDTDIDANNLASNTQSNQESSAPAPIATTKIAESAPAPSAVASTLPTTRAGEIPPWEQGELIHLTAEMRAHALPNRQNPGTPVLLDADQAWAEFIASIHEDNKERKTEFLVTETGTPFAQACYEAFDRLNQQTRSGSAESDAVILAIAFASSGYGGFSCDAQAFIRYLVAQYHLQYAIEALIAAEQIRLVHNWRGSGEATQYTLSQQVMAAFHYDRFCHGEYYFRTILAQANEADWQEAAAQLQAAVPQLHPSRQILIALLLPECPDFANQLTLDLANSDVNLLLMALVATSDEARNIVLKQAHSYDGFGYQDYFPSTIIQQHGAAAVELLESHSHHAATADMLAQISTPNAIAVLARLALLNKESQQRFIQACQRYPLAAIPALTDLLQAGGKDSGLYSATLANLLQHHAEALAQTWPWLSPGAHNIINTLQARFAAPAEVASEAELPLILRNPPWLQKKKTTLAALELEVQPLAAVEHWSESEREQVLALNEWQAKRLEEARMDTAKLADELGFGRYSGYGSDLEIANNKQIHTGILNSAINAIQNNNSEALIEAWKNYKAAKLSWWLQTDSRYLTLLPEPVALKIWPTFAADDSYNANYAMATYGLKGLDGLLVCIQQRPASEMSLALHYGWTPLAPAIARAYLKLKTARADAKAWLLQFPEHAITGLIPNAVGKAGEARDCAGAALRLLAEHGHSTLIEQVAARYQREAVSTAVQAVLDEDPLDRFPSKISKAPNFWLPQSWQRPRLLNGKPFANDALEHLGTMLRFPTTEGVYPGIAQVKAACQAQSLTDFAWDCFNQWLFAASPAKENWAMQSLAFFGTDDTARKLTPLIRAWPGESQHARAVAGLDVLAAIGSDTALMLLNGIAQKVKFKGLQDKAREKIAAIAEARELTTEELEDRLAPDLGLDEHGTLLLDFGPRQFRVGFDEALKPYVRDMEGTRLADLPKPKKTDSEDAKAAVELFKLLKKDVKTIASQQVQRLETAMCQRRRWNVDVFITFLATHPLLRHLVQRLVWGVYRVEGEGRYGGELLATFRVTEDASYATPEDDEYTLPEGEIRIGLPHALELPASDAAQFGQCFADYQLLQPFAQLSRDSHRFSPQEAEQEKLSRWQKNVVPTGKIMGLTNKGWRRGEAQDSGCIWYYTKDIGNGRFIELTFEPGMIVGMLDEYPEQTLQELTIGQTDHTRWLQNKTDAFATLDAIVASELIRDMETLIS